MLHCTFRHAVSSLAKTEVVVGRAFSGLSLASSFLLDPDQHVLNTDRTVASGMTQSEQCRIKTSKRLFTTHCITQGTLSDILYLGDIQPSFKYRLCYSNFTSYFTGSPRVSPFSPLTLQQHQDLQLQPYSQESPKCPLQLPNPLKQFFRPQTNPTTLPPPSPSPSSVVLQAVSPPPTKKPPLPLPMSSTPTTSRWSTAVVQAA